MTVRRLLLAIVMLPALVAGCGDRNLILTVDILSFLDPSAKTTAYGPIPPGLPSTSVDVVSDSLNLLQGIGDVTRVVTASLRIGASFDNQTGSANGNFLLYIAPGDSADPFTTPPIASIPVSLLPGQVTNVNTEVSSSPALAAALTQDRAKFGLRLTFDTSGSAGFVQGTETLTELKAIVVTKKDL
jgi:hypothetical protein